MKFFLILNLLFFNVFLESAEKTESGFKGPIIGIDLGTTYSCVGIFRNGRVEIIQNDQGNRITPSYVAFLQGGERLIGDSAKSQLIVNPKNTVFDVKRLIGRRFTDPSVQSDMKLWPFKVVNKGDRPYIQIDTGDKTQTFAPEEISAMVLSKMRDIASSYLGQNVTDAVVTVPAYFSDAQRQSTKDAGTIAGINVVRIINEPTAAAMAYGIANKDKEMNILIFDLGGGTFDVSALTLDTGVFEVASTHGDTHLGGEDFDNRLMEHVIKLIQADKRKFDRKDLTLVQKLRREVEKAKRVLSRTHEVTLELEIDGEEFSTVITRPKFEQINDDLFRKTLGPLKKCIEDSGIAIKDFDQILLVGGSTRIPKIQQLVRDFFQGKEPNRGINPDEAVAYGAAIQGGILSGEKETSDIVLLDVNSLTLGVMVQGGMVEPIIKRNSKIPNKQSKQFSTVMDNQEVVRIEVYEGERPMAKDNNKLGHFDLTGLPRAPRGQPQIEVTFSLDNNGIIHVMASEKSSGKSNNITIRNEQRQLKQEEIDKMIEDAQKYADEDAKTAEKVKARTDFESVLYQTRNQMKEDAGLGGKLADEEKDELTKIVDESISWLEQNQSASIEEIKEQKAAFEKVAQPILAKYGPATQPEFQQPGGEQQEEGAQEQPHEEL